MLRIHFHLFLQLQEFLHEYQYIVQIIDTGIDGLLFPHVETKEQLDKIINLTFLFPDGNKSYSPFVSRFNYGLDKKNKNNLYLEYS